jgi:predicted amidophosphoribosyltransferase
MPLLPCPECKAKVSDRAKACPKCGYPMEARPVQRSVTTTGPKHNTRNLIIILLVFVRKLGTATEFTNQVVDNQRFKSVAVPNLP